MYVAVFYREHMYRQIAFSAPLFVFELKLFSLFFNKKQEFVVNKIVSLWGQG